MVFNSFDFVFFLILVFLLFWIVPNNKKWIILLLSSYFFYMYWNPIYILLLLVSTFIDFYISLYLTSSNNLFIRKVGLYLSVFLSLLILVSFKYLDFFLDLFKEITIFFGISLGVPHYNILLPMGISFYTFQSLSYVIDVYRKDISPEKNFFKFALYISFFPQLVAGPIERAKHLLPQLKKKVFTLKISNIKLGLFYILWGLFQKNVIADNSAFIVDSIFDNSVSQNGGALLYASILFSFQIYTDFAGYSNMAIGVARLFDIQLTTNFKSPFLAESVTEFWRRWHISLSVWIRDYIYIPLGGNRISKYRTYLNLIVVFVVIGIWHGASFNFIIWGLLHSIVLILERLFKFNNSTPFFIVRYLKIVLTFTIVSLIFISFRIKNIQFLLDIYYKIFYLNWRDFIFYLVDNYSNFAFIGILILLIIEFILKNRSVSCLLKMPKIFFYPFCFLLFFMIVLLSRSEGGQFIYFQF